MENEPLYGNPPGKNEDLSSIYNPDKETASGASPIGENMREDGRGASEPPRDPHGLQRLSDEVIIMFDQENLAIKRRDAILEIAISIYRAAMRKPESKELLAQACRLLCEEGGYHGAWALLTDGSGRTSCFVRETAGRTPCMNMNPAENTSLPRCARDALDNGGAVTVTDTALFCTACIAPESIPPVEVYCVPLVYVDRKFGVLTIITRPGEKLSDEEKGSLDRSAEALAFSMHVSELLKKPDEAEARRKSLRKLLDTMQEGAALHEIIRDSDGKAVDYRILDVNPAYKRHTSIDQAMAIGARGSELYKMSPPPGLAAFVRVSETGEPANFEIEHAESGRIFQVSAFALNRLVGAVFEDITLDKATRTMLAENEAKYRVLVENTKDIPFSADSKGIMTYIGPQAAEYGFNPIEIVSRPFTEFILPEDREMTMKSYREAVASGNESPAEFRILDKERNIRWMESRSRLVVDDDGSPVGITGVLRDVTDRKAAEKALAESEAKYRTLVENTDDVVYLIDAEGRLSYTSQQVTRYNLDAGNLLGTRFLDHVHPNDRDQVRKAFDINESTPAERVPTEFRLIAPGEEFFWLEERGAFLRDGQGKIVGRSGILRDVTDRKRTENALRRSEEQKRAILQTLPDTMILMNGQGRCIDIHSPSASEPGLIQGDFNNRTVHEFLKPILAEQVQKALSMAIETGHVQTLEFSLESDSGPRHYEARMVRAGENLVLNLVRDISDRRRNELALKESETKFRSTFENAGTGIAIMTTSGRFLEANTALCEMLGYSNEELTKHSSVELTHPDDLESTYNVLKQIEDDTDVVQFEKRLLDKQGDVVWVTINASVVREAQGKPVYLLAHFQNDTHKRLAEKERERLQAQLLQAQKMEVVGRMAGGMAHDFNNLLTPILGYSEIAMARLAKDNPLFPKIAEIRNAAERAASLTRQLLTFSRKQLLDIRAFDLNATVSDCTNLLRQLVGENIRLEMKLDPNLRPAMGDSSQIQQVIMNLAVNARDAMPKGGVLTIETRNVSFTEEESTKHANLAAGNYVSFSVADSGIGMNPEAMKHLFEPFFTTKARGKGTGLGLSTIYGIIRQHLGAVEVHSEPEIGTAFTVFIPQAQESEIKPVLKPQPASEAGNFQATVLVVEDEMTVRALATEILSSSGFSVLAASGPEEALRVLDEYKGRVDLLLTDVMMPKMNGKELYAKSLESRPDLKVVFMSGYAGDVIAEQGLAPNRPDFIQKPFDSKSLLEKVSAALSPR